ncbi:MAG: putative lipid II flippase FtsW [Deltaproteobacteria bacterium]|jgi:cell division protein FtsW|nr:putative lipid II flippase FtsW [Deltaproteobacteria bacterium]
MNRDSGAAGRVSAYLRQDTVLVSVVILLAGIGLATLLSASYLRAELYEKDPYFYFNSQALRFAVGAACGFAAFLVPVRFWMKAGPVVGVLTVLLLLLPLVPGFQASASGATRWISLGGLSFQPSEFAKVGIIIYMCWSLSTKGELARGFWYGFVTHSAVIGIFCGLILLERDLGGAVVACVIICGMSFASGLRWSYVALFAGIVSVACWQFVSAYGYRVARIRGWLDPWADPTGAGYVILHSFYAFANGGIFGTGPGEGLEKQFFIPEIHTDYIFTVVGEELGLAGVLLVAGLFLAYALRGLWIAKASPGLPGYYMAVGAALAVGVPAFINMGVALSLWPSKGLALPFFSHGGSNLVASLVCTGLLLRVAADGWMDHESGGAAAAPAREATAAAGARL